MTPAVWLVAPPARVGSDRLEELRKQLISHFAGEKDWNVKTLRHRVVVSRARGESRRPYQLLEPQDAFQLYRAMHRQPVVIFQLAATKILKNPASGPTERNTMTLEQFVRYKAFFALATAEVDWRSSIEPANDWAMGCSCDGEDDARCLPLHTFCPNRDWRELNFEQGGFDRFHGRSGRRADELRRRWNKTTALHGKDIDVVAGQPLRQGFHWDVDGARNISSIANAKEVWTIAKGGYINIYPDATFRGGKLSKQAYEASRPSSEVTGGPRPRKREPVRRGPRK